MSKDLSTTTITAPNGIKKKIIIMNKKIRIMRRKTMHIHIHTANDGFRSKN